MLHIALCDDQPVHLGQLQLVLQHALECKRKPAQVVLYDSGEKLLSALEDGARIDIVFLDIYMNGIDGVETARAIRRMQNSLHIVFLTTAPDFAAESYEVEASGYLLKPVSAEKLGALLDKLTEHSIRQQLAIKVGVGYRYIDYDNLVLLESKGHTVTLHLADGGCFSVYEKLDNLHAKLNDARFLRSHKSFLVNLDYVQAVNTAFVLRGGLQAPIRVRSRKDITDQYYRYFVRNMP